MLCLPLLHWASTLQASFQGAESRIAQPRISSYSTATAREMPWCGAAGTENDLAAAKVQPQMARTPAGSQICCRPWVPMVIPVPAAWQRESSLHPCLCLLPQSLGARRALDTGGWPALMRNGDNPSLCCLRRHGSYHESMWHSL